MSELRFFWGFTCETPANEGTGSRKSQTGFILMPVVIGTAVLFLIVIVIWKVYQKRRRPTLRESHAQACTAILDDIEPYYVSRWSHTQPMTDDNPYSDAEERMETTRNTHCSSREGAGNNTNIYINQREKAETEASAYLSPRKDLQANKYQQKRRQTLLELHVQAYTESLDDIEPYYVSKPNHTQSMTDDNPYSDVEERMATNRNACCNIREGAGNNTNIYINQREEAETEASLYLSPREDLQANMYLELLPN